MSDPKPKITRLLLLLALLPLANVAHSLDVGFEGLLTATASDNVEGANSPDEEDGVTAGAVFGVYGEQRGQRVDAGFKGEIDTRRVATDEDGSFSTLTRFLGAADISLTPRSWRWYFGNILGGVRTDNALQTIDDVDVDRRNIFVTGPSFEYDVEGVSRTRARLLYVNQTEQDRSIETLYTANFSYARDTTPGSYFGFRLGDVFTQAAQDETDAGVIITEEADYNRVTGALFWNRLRGFLEIYSEIGMTRYDADDESLNGLNAQIRATRAIGPQSSFNVLLSRDLNDQNLSTVESLISAGGEDVGLQPETAGFFADTRLSVAYDYQGSLNSANVGVGVGQLDYQLLASEVGSQLDADSEDQIQMFAFGTWSSRLTNRLRGELGFRYERQEYDNRLDETDSVLATATLVYQLSRSFQLEGSLAHDTASGVLTRFTAGSSVLEDIDVTENRATIGIRWAPPSRASQDLTVELKSLLQ